MDQCLTEEILEEGGGRTAWQGKPLGTCRGDTAPNLHHVLKGSQPMSRSGDDTVTAARRGKREGERLVQIPVRVQRRFR